MIIRLLPVETSRYCQGPFEPGSHLSRIVATLSDGLTYERSQRMEAPLRSEAASALSRATRGRSLICQRCTNRPDTPYTAELGAIYILPEGQGKGTGALLMRRFAEAMVADGLDSLAVWVLADNERGRRFYEAMGGVLAARRQITIAGQTLDEVAYGWTDIHSLVR